MVFQLQEDHAEIQKRHLLQTVYNYMSRGMFKNDRLSFFVHLVGRMYPNTIANQEMSVFLENTIYQSLSATEASDLPAWIPETSIMNLYNLKVSLLFTHHQRNPNYFNPKISHYQLFHRMLFPTSTTNANLAKKISGRHF